MRQEHDENKRLNIYYALKKLSKSLSSQYINGLSLITLNCSDRKKYFIKLKLEKGCIYRKFIVKFLVIINVVVYKK